MSEIKSDKLTPVTSTTTTFGDSGDKLLFATGTNLDMNGVELILDADADTSITADTDDQIDIRIAGADDFRFTANSMNVLSGSTLTIDSGATITNSGTATGFADLTAIADGSVGSPSIANSGDTNTGIYFPAADTVGVVAGGKEKWRFGSSPLAGKNYVVNGMFQVDQRLGETRTGLGGALTRLADQWVLRWDGATGGRYTFSVEDNGGVNSESKWAKLLTTTADAAGTAGDFQYFYTPIEAQNLQGLIAANGKLGDTTQSMDIIVHADGASGISFPCKVGCWIHTYDGTARQWVQDVTITSADTWQRVSISRTADSVATIDQDSGVGMWMGFCIATGSDRQVTGGAWENSGSDIGTSDSINIGDATNNYIGFANVTLEAGLLSTAAEVQDYGTTLIKCQRYYEQREPSGNGYNLPGTYGMFIATTSTAQGFFQWNVEKRAAPTIDMIAATDWIFVKTNSGSNNYSGGEMTASAFTFSQIKTNHCAFLITTGTTGGTAGHTTWIQSTGSNHKVTISAEL
jgi:hypothetical protein